MKKIIITYDIKVKQNLDWSIFNPTQHNLHNSFLYNYRNRVKNDAICTDEYIILDISNNGKYIALASKKWDARTHNNFVVKEIETNKVLFQTNKYLVYTANFSPNDDFIITTTYKNNGFLLRIKGCIMELDKLSYSVGGGTFIKNKYLTGNERKKSTLIIFDFDNLTFSEELIEETTSTIQKINSDKLGNIYTIDKKFVVRKHNPENVCLWEVKYKKDDFNFCNTPPRFYINQDLDILIFYAPNQKREVKPRTYIGQKLSTGEKIEIENKGEDTGFIEAIFYKNKVIDSFGVTLDLKTGLTENIFE